MLLPTLAPSSQKAGDRPISFILTDNSVSPPSTSTVEMIIRPEELTRTDASRITVQQTLGGAWADSFGPGLTTINISGTTGWRGNPLNGGDGMDQFASLKSQVYIDWHTKRNAAVQAGIDPAQVTLTFADALDEQVDIVIPMSFTLRRSKSRPLLMQFNIAMIVVPDDPNMSSSDSDSDSSSSDPLGLSSALSGLPSLSGSLSSITSAIGSVSSMVPSNILGPVTSFMNTSTALGNAITAQIGAAQSISSSLLSTASAVAQGGMNMFATIAASATSTIAQAAAMTVSAAFSNTLCVLSNTVNQQQTYPDYTPLLGASNCSSTNGGSPVSPYANTNPFYALVGAPQNALPPSSGAIALPSLPLPKVSVTPAAQQALAMINNADPVLAPMSLPDIGAAAGDIASGISLS